MISIEKDLNDNLKISFQVRKPSGKKAREYIYVKFPNEWTDNISISPPALCDIQPDDMPEYIEALELATKIATGDIRIN